MAVWQGGSGSGWVAVAVVGWECGSGWQCGSGLQWVAELMGGSSVAVGGS
jgi:hypothetical protein